ncbi:MAG: UDP-N-acetylmuramoyl-L-alanyl-D-glutamate--2,6-diaminopimelate ligase [Peptococcaceae bacterium]|nr:UDP-N-acetylmuramoyl-L-alanyl-D-glutamate--2,6-diaminopimelate ligase [Peptococcaceae bacterium]
MSKNSKTLRDITDGLKNCRSCGDTEIEIIEMRGDAEVEVSGLTHDSRKIEQGDIFVCIKGFKTDGHDFAAQAVQAGAKALLVERYLELNVPQIKVRDTRQAVGYLAAAFYNYPSRELELVGVTGTNGKTTVTHLVEEIARLEGKRTGMIGTLGSRINGLSLPGQHTTPESTEIQKLLKAMVDKGVNTAVMEVSSHALALGRVNGCVYSAGIFTNLSQDHLDYHHSMQEYLEAKSILFAGMCQDEQTQFAVLNADDESCRYLQQKAACRTVTYGFNNPADFTAHNIKLSAEGVEFDVTYHGLNSRVFYPTPGKFSVYNALAAFTWGIMAGYNLDTVQGALKKIKGVPGRFQSIRRGQPFIVIVDYAHTPDGLANVLTAAREITSGRLITVFGCGGDRDRTKRPLMGKAAEELSDYVIVTSDNPRTEDPENIIKDILPGLKSGNYKVLTDRREAIVQACSLASKGDTVLIAGKGHEDYQIIGTEKIHFDDREEVEKALRRMGYVEE